jgi:hypothetical protein
MLVVVYDVCCVLCVVCCVVFACIIYHFAANQLVEINGGKLTNKQTLLYPKYKATTKHPDIIRCLGVK